MVLDKVAEERAISVDQNDLTQHILRKAQSDGVAPQQVADHLKEHPHHIEEYMLEIRRAKALALIVESATVTDSNGAKVELATLGEDGTYAARRRTRPLTSTPTPADHRSRRAPVRFRTGARCVSAVSGTDTSRPDSAPRTR